jgi:hypothetical protein
MSNQPDTAGDCATKQLVTAKEAYLALVQLIIHAESTTWNRFYNFLMGNSILVVAWAALFASNSKSDATPVLVTICLLGAFGGIAWAALAVRGRRNLNEFVELGKLIEAESSLWTTALAAVKPLSKAADLRETQAFPWAGSFYLLVFGSLAFSVLYSVMLIVSVEWIWAAAPIGAIGMAGVTLCWFAFRTPRPKL